MPPSFAPPPEMATLQDNGCRYYANPARTEFRWIHPLEQQKYFPDWTDCTDMDDAQFAAFVTAGA